MGVTLLTIKSDCRELFVEVAERLRMNAYVVLMLIIILYIAGGILALGILSLIPGVKLLVTPVITLLTKLVESFFVVFLGYFIWLIKAVFFSYIDVFKHLFGKREKFLPTDNIKE